MHPKWGVKSLIAKGSDFVRGVTFWVPTHAPQSLVTRPGVYLPFSRIMHVVLPWSWPSHGSYLSQGLPAVAWILHESGLPPTGTRTYGLEATFLCYCSELSRSKASSRCRPLHGLSYPWASGGNTMDISAWLCLLLVTPYLGDAFFWRLFLLGDVFAWRCLCLAMPLSGDASLGRCVSWATPLLGDASLGRCLSWAMSFLGDVWPPDLPLSNTSVTHNAATTDYVCRRMPLP